MARKNAIVSVEVAGSAITFNVEGQKAIKLDTADLTSDIAAAALTHGIVQKVSDAAALGKDATPADKHAAMLAVVERLSSPDGSWNKRTGDGEGSAPSGLIFKAFYEFAKARAAKAKKPEPTEEAVRNLYDSKTRSEQLAMRKIPEVAEIMERMKADRASATPAPDADALLGELLG